VFFFFFLNFSKLYCRASNTQFDRTHQVDMIEGVLLMIKMDRL